MAHGKFKSNLGLFYETDTRKLISEQYNTKKEYSEQEILDRLNCINNYLAFAVETEYFQDTLCRSMRSKAESLPIENGLETYIDAIDFQISPTDKKASSAIERLEKVKHDFQKFDTLIGLQKTFVSLKKQIEQKINAYDQINASFTEYLNKTKLPNGPEGIGSMKEINSNMQTMLYTVDTLINLQKTYYSLKDQIEQIASSYKQIFATYTTYISETGVPSGVEPENLIAMRKINSNMQKILNTLKSSELKALEKEIKSFKNDEASKIKRLIGD